MCDICVCNMREHQYNYYALLKFFVDFMSYTRILIVIEPCTDDISLIIIMIQIVLALILCKLILMCSARSPILDGRAAGRALQPVASLVPGWMLGEYLHGNVLVLLPLFLLNHIGP